ncbi:shikimate kinase [Hypnocyclicus thermotrophus]|uniref:Shikimate kinase n=1 Tax=Hypnocyclicus thermotrophus TaxID=1627895 RepID=A0AA46I671_9FUSO|nr:shikimate kinase [Hypnocyclicus thermotrophus]TDT72013.1 shikimate kinase [Hypnocyclicus thermotrophus]
MKTNLALIGFMGVGKTTIGKVLAKKIDMNFFDLDYEIMKRENMKVNEIFKEKGEHYFRNLEEEIIKECETMSNTIIATGGGTILNKNNLLSLRKHANICLISTSIDNIYKRVMRRPNKRPLLICKDTYEKIKKLLNDRKDIYKNSCDFEVYNKNEDLDEITDIIKKIYIEEM